MSEPGIDLPTPTDVLGPVHDVVGGALQQGAGSVIDGVSAWLFSSLADLCSAVFGFVDAATRPNVTAAWFVDGSTGTGPYRAMATVAATIMCVLTFAGIVQGVAQADIAGMVRRMLINVPMAVVGIGGTVVVVQVLLDLTDSLSLYITSSVGADTQTFVTSLHEVATKTGSPGAPMLVLGLLMLVAAIVVFVELLVRTLLVYLIVALCPLAWAALVWPAIQGALRKTLELLVAVILSKVVVALAIAVGAAALSGTAIAGGSSPELVGYTFPEPGTVAASTAGTTTDPSLTSALGLLATGVATLAVAAFSPFLIARLLPFAEAAVVAQGTRGAPMRAGQQVFNMKHQLDMARRFGGQRSPGAARSGSIGTGGAHGSKATAGVAKGGVGAAGGASSSAGGGAAAGAGAGTAAAAGPAGAALVVAGAAVGGAKRTAQRGRSAVESQSGPASSTGGSKRNGRSEPSGRQGAPRGMPPAHTGASADRFGTNRPNGGGS